MSANLHLLRPKEAMKYVGTKSTLDRLARDGEIEFVVVGLERRYFLGSLLDWQARNRRKPLAVQTKRPTREELRAAFAACK